MNPSVKSAVLLPVMFAAVTFQYTLVAAFVVLSWPAQALVKWLTPKVSGYQAPSLPTIPIPGGRPN